VSIRRRGHRKPTTLTHVTLAKGRCRTFKMRTGLRVGDRITTTVAANKRTHQATMTVNLTATRRLLRAASRQPKRR